MIRSVTLKLRTSETSLRESKGRHIVQEHICNSYLMCNILYV